MLETLDDDAVRRWCGGGLAALRAHQREIDELNVYPVPDGDTGTNLVLTLTSAQQALDRPADDPPTGGPPPTPLVGAMRRMARGALLGARGNSGVIVSQILRGMADTFATAVAVRGSELARAFRTATEAAYAAVARPVEGTVLSVVAAAADGAGRIGSDDLVAVARAASRSAAEALARTPQQLPALARAGVVDAGGRGLCLLLDALVDALSPRPGDESGAASLPLGPGGASGPSARDPAAITGSALGAGAAAITGSAFGAGAAAVTGSAGDATATDLGYEVQYLLDAPEDAVGNLRRTLDALGESLVIVGTGAGDPPTWNVHVHVDVDDIGAAIEAAVEAGRPHRITVTHLTEAIRQAEAADRPPMAGAVREGGGVHEPGPERVVGVVVDARAVGDIGEAAPGLAAVGTRGARDEADRADRDGHGPRGAVVVAAGDGLTALFEAEGATVVGRNPSTAEMLAAIEATGADDVVLLPNDANTHAVAASAAREAAAEGVRVSVVPTRSPVQALAALAVRDAGRAFADDVIAMAEAAGACRYGEVCTAMREALTVAGRCRTGDLLGLVDGEVHVIGTDLEDVSRKLLDRMLGGGGELVTLVLGADAPAGLSETLFAHAGVAWPFVEVQSYAGGQPRYHLLVGVE